MNKQSNSTAQNSNCFLKFLTNMKKKSKIYYC